MTSVLWMAKEFGDHELVICDVGVLTPAAAECDKDESFENSRGVGRGGSGRGEGSVCLERVGWDGSVGEGWCWRGEVNVVGCFFGIIMMDIGVWVGCCFFTGGTEITAMGLAGWKASVSYALGLAASKVTGS